MNGHNWDITKTWLPLVSELDHFKATILEYCTNTRELIFSPRTFFSNHSLPGYQTKLFFAMPPVLVYATAVSLMNKHSILSPFYVLVAYGEIALWAASLRYVVKLFGEQRSFDETLHIAVSAAIFFAIAWIPMVGPPAAFVGAALWTVFGLVNKFKMNKGAALTAVSLPVVVSGFAIGILLYLLMLLSSVSRLFIGG